jgi:hypothetical protein
MTDTKLATRPEVTEFVGKVRAHLADLTEEEREELLGGLEADLTERLADGDVTGFGDPRAYAEELRAAAGLESSRARVRRPRRPAGELVGHGLDRSRAWWERTVTERPWSAACWSTLVTLRPAWWVLRAWVAVQLLDYAVGPWEYLTLIPHLGGGLVGPALLGVAVVGSVLMGMRKAWPASHAGRSVFARVVLLVLNTFAVLATPAVVDAMPSAWMLHHSVCCETDYSRPDLEGLYNDGRVVRNVFAYDAEGNPLEGVQLYDQRGKPLAIWPDQVVRMRYEGRTPVIYPWTSGRQQMWNVFPLPVRTDNNGWDRREGAWSSDNPPFLPEPPLVVVPRVSLPLPEADPDSSLTEPAVPGTEPAEPEPSASSGPQPSPPETPTAGDRVG